MNNIFGANYTSDDAKVELKTILDYVEHKYQIKLEADVMQKIHLEGLAARIIQLVGAQLTVSVTDVKFDDDQPYLPHFFEFTQPNIMSSVDTSMTNKFLDSMGDQYYALVNHEA